MSIFTDEEVCNMFAGYIETPHLTSDLVLDVFHNRAEQITMKCVQSGALCGKRQNKHVREFCIRARTRLERLLGGERMYYVCMEDWQHDN